MTPATAGKSPDLPVAALIERAAKGKRLTEPERDALRHELLRMKKNGNVSWAMVGSVYGLSAPEMRQVRKTVLAPVKHGRAT